jgi:hypothetical protein
MAMIIAIATQGDTKRVNGRINAIVIIPVNPGMAPMVMPRMTPRMIAAKTCHESIKLRALVMIPKIDSNNLPPH